MRFLKKHPYVIAGGIFVAVLAMLVWMFPGSRQIDVTFTATEYRPDDLDFAEEHLVTIKGLDSRQRFSGGSFQGTISVSGLEKLSQSQNMSVSLSKLSGKREGLNLVVCDASWELFAVYPNWEWDNVVFLLTDQENRFSSESARFLISGPADREAAFAMAKALTDGVEVLQGYFE